MGKNTQKPSTEQIYLLCRGAEYLWRQPNILKSRVQSKSICYVEAPGIYGASQTYQKPSTEQIYLLWDLRLEGREGISGEDKHLIPRLQSPGVV